MSRSRWYEPRGRDDARDRWRRRRDDERTGMRRVRIRSFSRQRKERIYFARAMQVIKRRAVEQLLTVPPLGGNEWGYWTPDVDITYSGDVVYSTFRLAGSVTPDCTRGRRGRDHRRMRWYTVTMSRG